MTEIYTLKRFKPIVTQTLIVLCVGFYLLNEGLRLLNLEDVADTLLGTLCYYDLGIYFGQVWRLFTASLLHGNFMHLLLNMASLWVIGSVLERLFGVLRMVGIWLFADAFAGLFTYAFSNYELSVGASGAIFGMVGALLALYFISRSLYQRYAGRDLWVVVGINFFYALIANFMLDGNINIFAHVGGFIGGAVMALAVGLPGGFKRSALLRITGIIGGIFLLFILLIIGTARYYI